MPKLTPANVYYKFVSHAGLFVRGVAERDHTQAEFEALDQDARDIALATGILVPTALEPSKPISKDGEQ